MDLEWRTLVERDAESRTMIHPFAGNAKRLGRGSEIPVELALPPRPDGGGIPPHPNPLSLGPYGGQSARRQARGPTLVRNPDLDSPIRMVRDSGWIGARVPIAGARSMRPHCPLVGHPPSRDSAGHGCESDKHQCQTQQRSCRDPEEKVELGSGSLDAPKLARLE